MNEFRQIKECLRAMMPEVKAAFDAPLSSVESAKTISKFFNIANPDVIFQLIVESDERDILEKENAKLKGSGLHPVTTLSGNSSY
ncbi:MAG TPA: hypothetical protein VGL07_17020 [Buttiauxella sp.]|jgi:hypothetical protein